MRTYQDINFLALFFRKDATNEIFIENILLTNISLYTVESFRRIFRKKKTIFLIVKWTTLHACTSMINSIYFNVINRKKLGYLERLKKKDVSYFK